MWFRPFFGHLNRKDPGANIQMSSKLNPPPLWVATALCYYWIIFIAFWIECVSIFMLQWSEKQADNWKKETQKLLLTEEIKQKFNTNVCHIQGLVYRIARSLNFRLMCSVAFPSSHRYFSIFVRGLRLFCCFIYSYWIDLHEWNRSFVDVSNSMLQNSIPCKNDYVVFMIPEKLV